MIHTVEHHYHGFYSQQCTHIASSAAEAESAAVATGFTAAWGQSIVQWHQGGIL